LGREFTKSFSVVVIEEMHLSTFAVSPLKQLSFDRTRNSESEVRLPRTEFARVQILQQNAERLLRYIIRREPRLLSDDATSRPVKHGEKGENQKIFNECGVELPNREKVAQ
jgi:hypothetical protein